MTELLNLDVKTWKTAGNLGNTGATGATAIYSKKVYADTLAEWSIAPEPGSTQQFQNGYWFYEVGAQNLAVYFEYEFDLWVPAAAKPNCIEFELQQQINGMVFNYALQAQYSGGQWRSYNFGEKMPDRGWAPTGLPFVPFVTNQWHHLKAQFERTRDIRTRHVALEINGAHHEFDIQRDAYNLEVGRYATDKFNVGFQLDMKLDSGPFSVFTKNLTVRYE
jgi:hypothetical protein